VDEACANTRVQLDSQPEAIDNLERRRLQLEVEATALAKEDDEVSLLTNPYFHFCVSTNNFVGEQAKIEGVPR
jgi:ATP-dependent Clp protease ATP-binding subunit ClpA